MWTAPNIYWWGSDGPVSRHYTDALGRSTASGPGSWPVVKVVLWSRGGAHLTKPGWSKPQPHTHSNPTNLALFRHKIALYRFNQGAHTIAGGSNRSRGAEPPPPSPPHFNHWSWHVEMVSKSTACRSYITVLVWFHRLTASSGGKITLKVRQQVYVDKFDQSISLIQAAPPIQEKWQAECETDSNTNMCHKCETNYVLQMF